MTGRDLLSNAFRNTRSHLIVAATLVVFLSLQVSVSGQDTVPSAHVERFISPGKLHYTCIPILHAPASVFYGFQLKEYDELSHTWHLVPSSDSALSTAMKGYSVWSDQVNPANSIVNYKGVLNTGPKTINLSRTWNQNSDPPSFDGWNLAGNPYPSALDLESTAFTLTNVDPTVYYFDGINYRPYNRLNGIGNGSRYIPSTEGFFLHVTSGSSGTVTVDNSCRLHQLLPFLKSVRGTADLLVMESVGNGMSDETFIHFDSLSASYFDWQSDAYKLYGIQDAPQVYSMVADTAASINVRQYSGPNTTVDVGFRPGITGEFQLIAHNLASFQTIDSIYLEDKLLNRWQNLSVDSVYSYTSSAGDDPNRFCLHFNYTYTGVGRGGLNSCISLYSWRDRVCVKKLKNGFVSGTLDIFDFTGRKVFRNEIGDLPLNVFRTGLGPGYFVARVITDDDTFSQVLFLAP